ncbi:MAG: bifunctional acetate--CoA ligase family protein/GNAT family N-acetyltransferase [Desulfovibrionaceae bacterium]
MTKTNLDCLFEPKSVAVVGAATNPAHPGNIVMRNLISGGFSGPVMPVSSEAEAIAGVLTYPDVKALPKAPDLAVICSEVEQAPEELEKLGERGARGVIVLSSFPPGMEMERRQELEQRMRQISLRRGFRMLGPKGMGLIAPSRGLNASLAHTTALSGKIAFATESDSLFTTVLDWASSNAVGFSCLVSLGRRVDVAFSDILDYLGCDPQTRSILLYMETTTNARKFMSAARAAARNKPLLVIRPGRALERIQEDLRRLGLEDEQKLSCKGRDVIYDMAFRRAGMLRVDSIDDLFDAAQTLNHLQPLRGNRMAIITNGASAGTLAADALLSGGGELASLSPETIEGLDTALGGRWTGANPVGLRFDADGEQYAAALKLLLKDKGVDTALVMHVPFAGVSDTEAAEAVAAVLKRVKRMVLTAWLGSNASRKARQIFVADGIPTYETPEQAIRAFFYMDDYRRGQELLMQTPDSLPGDFFPDTSKARQVAAKAREEERTYLDALEAEAVLAAYGVPMVETRITKSAREAVIAADELGYPVAVKLRSPQIPHPFEVGVVALDLEGPEKVWEAAAGILVRAARERPDAYIEGFTIQRMGRRPGAHELFLSANVDPVFGPVIRFGHGGLARDMIQDKALTLPPLNMNLARELISRTRISKLLNGAPGQPAADIDDICLTLIQISQLFIDVPELDSLDINPLFADHEGVLALNAKISVRAKDAVATGRLAIRPYPKELEEVVMLNDLRITLRPIRPEDEPTHAEFLSRLSDDDLRLRFFGVVRREFGHKDMARFTQIDYDREMAFIASLEEKPGQPETIGVIQTSFPPDKEEGEFAIVVRSDLKGQGLGKLLMEKMIRYAKDRGAKRLAGQTMLENRTMQDLAERFGFSVHFDQEEETINMVLTLNE